MTQVHPHITEPNNNEGVVADSSQLAIENFGDVKLFLLENDED